MTVKVNLVTAEMCTEIDAELTDSRIEVSAQTLHETTGWSVKPEGFCLGDICIPAKDGVDKNGNVDLVTFAELTARPIITDLEEGVVSLGTPFEARGAELDTLQAPDFTLPDLNGEMHSLADYRGKKILLAAYASW